jgi:NDP-sugar pyrophosphorylase family protein
MGDMVRETFGEAYGKMRLSYSPEPSPLGTGGAVRLALSLIDSDPALVMNGDSFFDADLEACYRSHVAAEDVETTMLVCNVSDTARYGRIQMADDRRVLHFDEKGALSGPGWINAGIYFLGRRMVAAIPSSRMISLERDIFPAWIGRGLYACPDEGRFLDIGTPESYREAQSFFDPDTTIHMRKKTRE